MPASPDLLDALLDSWDRNNRILIGLLRLLPANALDLRPHPDSPAIGSLFTHIHYVRLIFVQEDAPEFAKPIPEGEWQSERNIDKLATMLDESAQAVRDAVRDRLISGRPMNQHYDHPVLMLQHLIWHEGYHHGQIKLALKLAGQPIPNSAAGPATWRIWMLKTLPPKGTDAI